MSLTEVVKKLIFTIGDTFACLGEITSSLFDDPTGLAIDSADNLYVADQGTDMIYKFSLRRYTCQYISGYG